MPAAATSSRHRAGTCPAWSVDHHPADVPLSPLPDWLIARLTVAAAASTPEADRSEGPLASDVWTELTGQPIDEYRDMAAARIAGHLFRHNCDFQLVRGLLHAWNTAWCKPPLGVVPRPALLRNSTLMPSCAMQQRRAQLRCVCPVQRPPGG